MLMMTALKNKAVLRLWIGQLTSNIGDEIYKVAFIWMAVDLIGPNTGYLASIQLVFLLIFGVLGGKWSDHWNPYQTMINIDLIRMLLTLTPVIYFYLHRSSFIALVISSVMIAALGAFFEPAIQSSLPLLCEDKKTFKGANGLLSTTIRLARVMGPAIIGLLSTFILTIHFFTLNAITFLVSALSIYLIREKFPLHLTTHPPKDEHILKNWIDSWRTLKKHPELLDVVVAKTITGGAWGLTYGLGIALLVHEISSNNVKAFGMVMSAYGVGNVIAALIVGNMQRKNPAKMVYLGLAWLGIGFIGIAIANHFTMILFFAAFTAIGGPLNDIPCTDMIQSMIPIKDLPKVFRLKMTLDNLAALIFMSISPMLFHAFKIRTVILGCGVLILSLGAYYFWRAIKAQWVFERI